MPQMINRGQELIRICPKDAKKIEYSTNGGRAWMIRCQGTSTRDKFTDLVDNGKEILGQTDNGKLFYSTNEGRSWIRRR